ncbi:MAG: DUF6762 family protein [Clostridium sp.]
MDFSSLVLMQKDNEGYITKELGSFPVNEGALYIKKLFVQDNIVNLIFDTNKDVEEWEYSAIYDVFNYDVFKEEGFDIEDIDEEYNPTFLVKFNYVDDYNDTNEKIQNAVSIIDEVMEKAFADIAGKEDIYK